MKQHLEEVNLLFDSLFTILSLVKDRFYLVWVIPGLDQRIHMEYMSYLPLDY